MQHQVTLELVIQQPQRNTAPAPYKAPVTQQPQNPQQLPGRRNEQSIVNLKNVEETKGI